MSLAGRHVRLCVGSTQSLRSLSLARRILKQFNDAGVAAQCFVDELPTVPANDSTVTFIVEPLEFLYSERTDPRLAFSVLGPCFGISQMTAGEFATQGAHDPTCGGLLAHLFVPEGCRSVFSSMVLPFVSFFRMAADPVGVPTADFDERDIDIAISFAPGSEDQLGFVLPHVERFSCHLQRPHVLARLSRGADLRRHGSIPFVDAPLARAKVTLGLRPNPGVLDTTGTLDAIEAGSVPLVSALSVSTRGMFADTVPSYSRATFGSVVAQLCENREMWTRVRSALGCLDVDRSTTLPAVAARVIGERPLALVPPPWIGRTTEPRTMRLDTQTHLDELLAWAEQLSGRDSAHHDRGGQAPSLDSPAQCSECQESTPDHIEVWRTADAGRLDVEVIVPLWNQAEYVTDALESIALAARYDRSIVLGVAIIDDASSDGGGATATATCQRLTDEGWVKSARVLRLNSRSGPAVARNVGIAGANAHAVLFLDSDNELTPKGLHLMWKAFQDDKCTDLVYGTLGCFVDGALDEGVGGAADGSAEANDRRKNRTFVDALSAFPWNPAELAVGNYVDALSMVRTSWLSEHGGFPVGDQTVPEDWRFWLKMIGIGVHATWIPDLVGRYRARPTGTYFRHRPDESDDRYRPDTHLLRRSWSPTELMDSRSTVEQILGAPGML